MVLRQHEADRAEWDRVEGRGICVEATGILSRSFMNVLDLIKATIACGLIAFIIYSFPVIGQVIIIGILSLLWLSYAHRTLASIRRR